MIFVLAAMLVGLSLGGKPSVYVSPDSIEQNIEAGRIVDIDATLKVKLDYR